MGTLLEPLRKKTWRLSLVLLTLASLLFVVEIASAAPVSGTDVTYTTDAEFDQGTLVNVNHDAPDSDQLQLNKNSGTFPFIWVALSVRCTIAKIDTDTGTILGEYRTIADSVGCNQSSRTTVALDGSVWVGHRGPGGVTHVGLSELNECIDRNGNSTIETSSGYGDVKPWPGAVSDVSAAEDECIIHHVDTNATGLFDSRHMSIDASNKLWVGDFSGGHNFIRIDGTTGVIETPVRSFACGGYGGLIDKDGVIWSANGSAPGLLRWDPDAPDSATNPSCLPINNYGLAIDKDGFVFATDLGPNLYKISPDGSTITGPVGHGASNAQGLAVDGDGDVWVSSSLFCGGGCTIGHLKNDLTFVGNVPNPSGAGSTGVSVDALGKVWSANLNSHTATRIDPSLGPVGGGGTTVGAVDLTVGFPAGPDGRPLPYPYNYSDMTGAQLLGSTAPQGTWTVTQDSGTAGTEWGKVTWNTEPEGSEPAGTSITVEARASDSEAGLGSETYVAVVNGATFGMTGQFIQVRATLKANDAGDSPVLSDIRIQTGLGEPADLDLDPASATNEVGDEHCVTATVTDESGNPVPGVPVVFNVSGANSASGTATTDAGGQAVFCYTGAITGPDTITAFADTDEDEEQGGDEPGSAADKLWFAFAEGGQFVIGDLTPHDAGMSVNWWGSQWQKNNTLSGGKSPTQFKGFENSAAAPECGNNWTTDPGNSSVPPPAVPEYMGVIVSSKITSAGAIQSGDILEIVVVKTDPGYSPNPGHYGNGTVVATVCKVP